MEASGPNAIVEVARSDAATMRCMSLSVGSTFAGYRIERLLGSGGMGEVYLAQHPRLPRRDALKILRPDLSADPEFRMRFLREAAIAAALTHPNIVTVHDTGESDGQLWIATEYIDGTDAAQLSRSRYPAGMPIDDACAIVTAVASALDSAHDKGLLHRDVKPANLLLSQPDRDGHRHVYLADFGIARPLADPDGLTATNLTVGTVAYAAPEQLMGAALDGRADEYALAATAFHLLTGAQLYSDSNPVAVISRHLQAPAPALSERRPDLAALDSVFNKALAKDPAQRFDSCGEFAKALSPAGTSSSQHPTASGPAATGYPQQHPNSPRESRPVFTRRTLLVALATVVAVTGAVGAGIYWTRHKPAPVIQSSLEGTYRIVYDDAKRTTNGIVSQKPPAKQTITWWAYRSHCTSNGCVATGTMLDPENPTVQATPPQTVIRNFVDGDWTVTSEPIRVDRPRCIGDNGALGPGSNLAVANNTATPQPDGGLKGVYTVVVLTNECGLQGTFEETPYVATKTGEIPVGVEVRDPKEVPIPAPTTEDPPPPDAPVLDGTYRIDKSSQLKVNGVPTSGDAASVEYWAFRSSCTSDGCVATGQGLSDMNHDAPNGNAMVFEFKNGIWKQPPGPLLKPLPCANWGTSEATKSLSLTPQPDGTLKGMTTIEVIGGDCTEAASNGSPSSKGTLYTADATATRVGDRPQEVVLADPSLFH